MRKKIQNRGKMRIYNFVSIKNSKITTSDVCIAFTYTNRTSRTFSMKHRVFIYLLDDKPERIKECRVFSIPIDVELINLPTQLLQHYY